MAKLLAFEWDAREARVAVAHPRGREVVLEDAFTVPLSDERDKALDAAEIGRLISSALAARNISRGEALVSIGRASIELKQMTLPPSPEEELPDLVRFQALRQFTTISADWPLDFIPLQHDENGGIRVLAAAISPAMVEQIRATCQTCDQSPKRLILRPFAAASLLGRHDRAERHPPRLMVDILTDEADLTVLADKQVVLMRTVRLPATSGDEAVQSKSLLGELRRTIAAAQNQMQGKRIETIVLCGDGRDQQSLKEAIEQELKYAVDVFNPFELVKEQRAVADQRPEHVGRFAPLIGMLLDEVAGADHAIDFLHPRKKPAPPSNKRRNVLIGAAAATLMLAATLLIWFELSSRDAEIQDITSRSTGLKEAVASAQADRKDLAQLKTFLDGDVLWLDKLYEICELAPDPNRGEATRSFLVTSIRMFTADANGGEIVVDGYSRESGGIEQLRSKLREQGFEVIPGGSSEDQSRKDFRWSFSERLQIKPASAGEKST